MAGCIGCKEGGESVHRGRNGQPVVMVIVDESVPITVGITKKEGDGGCAWVLKKEHLGLGEVGGMLKVINEEKRDTDKSKGKQIHDFSCLQAVKSWWQAMFTLGGRVWTAILPTSTTW